MENECVSFGCMGGQDPLEPEWKARTWYDLEKHHPSNSLRKPQAQRLLVPPQENLWMESDASQILVLVNLCHMMGNPSL